MIYINFLYYENINQPMKYKSRPNAVLLFTQRNNISYYEILMEEVKKIGRSKSAPSIKTFCYLKIVSALDA